MFGGNNNVQVIGYIILFIPLSVGILGQVKEIFPRTLLFIWMLAIGWNFGVVISSPAWFSLALGLSAMIFFLKKGQFNSLAYLIFTILLFALLLGERISPFKNGLIHETNFIWAGLFDELLHFFAASIVTFPLLASEKNWKRIIILIIILLLASVIIDFDHVRENHCSYNLLKLGCI